MSYLEKIKDKEKEAVTWLTYFLKKSEQTWRIEECI